MTQQEVEGEHASSGGDIASRARHTTAAASITSSDHAVSAFGDHARHSPKLRRRRSASTWVGTSSPKTSNLERHGTSCRPSPHPKSTRCVTPKRSPTRAANSYSSRLPSAARRADRVARTLASKAPWGALRAETVGRLRDGTQLPRTPVQSQLVRPRPEARARVLAMTRSSAFVSPAVTIERQKSYIGDAEAPGNTPTPSGAIPTIFEPRFCSTPESADLYHRAMM